MTTPEKQVPTQEERIAKLPEWAKELIKNLQRERDVSVRELNSFLDKQTPSPFFTEENICNGDKTRKAFSERVYIQGENLCCEAHGLRLRIGTKYGSTNDNSITLQWEDEGRRCQEVAFVPMSFNMAKLIAKENMR